MTQRYIITSALPYINGVKHLGNLIGSILPADVYTRYLRLKGKDVIYICGTDEHGTPAELSALEAGKQVKEYCDEMYEIQKEVYEGFNIEFDYFGRKSDVENHEITQDIFLGLQRNGFINEKTSVQLYSIDDQRYLPDRYVIGTCPHCKYERARGDQCENCTTLLNPSELIEPSSAVSGSTKIEKREVRHLYIDLPELQPKVEKWIDKQTHWPTIALTIAQKWLREGLKERSITRNLDWGIEVPVKGYEDTVFYVWFDAPIGYISITKKWAKLGNKPDLFEKYWKDPKTKLIQFMGQDNVPFHSVTFPASLIGADLGYVLVHTLKGFQWLSYEGGKFSTSLNWGIFTDTALELYPSDYWRYYLLLIAPERMDTDFQWSGFQSAVNNDLNNLLGNLINRCLTFIHRHFEATIPDAQPQDREQQLHVALQDCIKEYIQTFDQIEFQKPVKALRKFWQECNRYFQEKKPWDTIKTNLNETKITITTLAHALRSIAILFAPIAPSSSEKIFEVLGLSGETVHQKTIEDITDWESLFGTSIPEIPGNLFTKITDREIAKLKKTYGSSETEKGKKSAKTEEKKQRKKKKKSKKTTIDYEAFADVKLISARILDAKKHPEADKLLVLTVDDGKRKDRTVVAGIAEFYKVKDLVNRNIIIVDNLKPRKLKGIKSEGMILAVDDQQTISLLQPDTDVSPGLPVK
ncbi:MAG: methionine--tRNA ligase [Candidatus Kariarchaeaceae archaeon]